MHSIASFVDQDGHRLSLIHIYSIAAIHKALELGINWIDTAAVYGLGHSEEVVARALKTTSHKPYIFTKCGLVWDEKREVTNSLKHIRREVEDSLRRLAVDTIDLYQVHWPKPDEEIEEAWGVMADLQKEGKVRWIGVSNFSVDQMERIMKIAPITSNQPPYSMLNRAVEATILPFCKKNNIGVINYAPMHSGLLKMCIRDSAWMKRISDVWSNTSELTHPPVLQGEMTSIGTRMPRP